MIAKLAAAAALLAAAVRAECPNACSGNGQCGKNDACVCDPLYMGSDCSQRLCPHHHAFVDTPAGDLNHDGLTLPGTVVANSRGNSYSSNVAAYELFPSTEWAAAGGSFAAKAEEGHFYMECSGKGSCNRATGQCVCSPGYTGSACQRASCPNDCSGKGKCRTLREVAAGALSRRAVGSVAGNLVLDGVAAPFNYNAWDADKHQMCVCDAGFHGPDCSQRQCPRGNDPLTPDTPRWCGGEVCTLEVQEFTLGSGPTSTYRFSFTDTGNVTSVAYATLNTATGTPGFVPDVATQLADPSSNAGLIMNALRNVPGGQLSQVEVYAMGQETGSALGRTFRVAFAGLSGDQYLMQVSVVSGGSGIDTAPKEVARGNMESIECSGRGNCNRVEGLCQCFPGYVGGACNYLNALAQGAKAPSA